MQAHTPPRRGRANRTRRWHMQTTDLKPYQRALASAIDWFESAGVTAWNFCVLTDRGMLGHERPRDRDEVLKSAGWGWVKNNGGGGCNVYLRPARGPGWPVIFLDDLPSRKALGISHKYSSLVVETSRDNCQCWIKCNRLMIECDRTSVQSRLAKMVGADLGSISGEHFGRAPGFRNRKDGRDNFPVRVLAATSGVCLDISPYVVSDASSPHPSPAGGRVRSELFVSSGTSSGDSSESAAEFRFCLARFRWAVEKGRDPSGDVEFLMQNILERAVARGKRSPDAYTKTTVGKALAAVLRRPSSL
ncbi:MAG: DNA-primase RepB domain-containing protein [Acidiferrobacter sp.]